MSELISKRNKGLIEILKIKKQTNFEPNYENVVQYFMLTDFYGNNPNDKYWPCSG